MSYDEGSLVNHPIVVVGAARSGTTMVRQALAIHPSVALIPYEVNYLWRHGNSRLPHDFLVPEDHLTPRRRRYIRKGLLDAARPAEGQRILDKTVANVVRLRYVQAVLPEAKILHIIRDGRAVAASALKRWSAPQPARYYTSKARFVPRADLAGYAWRYLKNRVLSLLRQRGYRQTWGVRFPGIDDMVVRDSLARVCAAQWRRSVEAALQQKTSLGAGTYMEVRYEELVGFPGPSFAGILAFLGLEPSDQVEKFVIRTLDKDRLDKWQEELDPDEIAVILDEERPLLERLGYF